MLLFKVLFIYLYFTSILKASPAACSTVCLYVLIVLLQCVPGDLLAHDVAASSPVIRYPVLLSIRNCLCQYHCAVVLFFPPPSAITCTSFFQFVHPPPPPPFFPSPTHSLLLHLSCRLFIRCVNNCLPTVVIAPPCQLEV